MNPNNTITAMIVYGNQSSYIQPPSDAQKAAGTVPLDTLPADWWNRMWMDITQNMNNAGESLESVYQELKHLLEAAGITPSSSSTSQVLAAVRRIARTIATSENAGAVVSSTLSGKVSVDQDGVMTPNGMGTPTQLNTSSKVIVTALNEVLTTLNNYMTTTNSALNGKAPVAHASSTTTYGLGNASNYGHVKLSSAVNSTSGNDGGVAATPAAVKAAYDLAQCACDLASGVSTSISVYCGSTCKCTINSTNALCLGSNAFNSTAFTTCVGTITSIKVYCGTTCKCEIKDAGGSLCLGSNAFNSTSFTTCTGDVVNSDLAATNADTAVALYTAAKTVGKSTSCALTFNNCTGVLKAKTFCGNTCGTHAGAVKEASSVAAPDIGSYASRITSITFCAYCTNASCTKVTRTMTFCGSTGYLHGCVCGNLCGCASNAVNVYRQAYTNAYDFDVGLTNGITSAYGSLYASASCRLRFCSTTGALRITNSSNETTGSVTAGDFIGKWNGCTLAQLKTYIKNQNKLSAPTCYCIGTSNKTVCYDGFVTIYGDVNGTNSTNWLYVNDIAVIKSYRDAAGGFVYPVNKGDNVRQGQSWAVCTSASARWYCDRDYS